MDSQPAVLVASAPWSWTTRLAGLARSAPTLLAADGGANHLARLGLMPAAVVGDMDSIDHQTRAWVGEERLVHRPDQDHTDLEKALVYALEELRLTDVVVLATMGGRVDHEIANLGLLARLRLGQRLSFRTHRELLMAVEGQHSLPALEGETWAFWTFDPRVTVSLDGVRWPVNQQPLDPAVRPSISNLATTDVVRVRAEGGPVLVMRQLRD